MKRQAQPPIPVAHRQQARRSMIWLAVAVAVVGVGAFAGWRTSGEPGAFWPVVPLLVLLAATAIRPGPAAAVLIVLGMTAAGWLFDLPLVGAGVGVALLGYGWLRSQSLPSDLQPEALEMVPGGAVGVGADQFVEQFTALGYRQVGALTAPVDGFPLIITIMIGPDADRYASVTDAILTVTSTFGARLLTTRNSALAVLAPEMLDNRVVGGTPAELDAAHSGALELLTSHVAVDTLDPDTTTALALANELRELVWVRAQPTHLRKGGNRNSLALAEQPRRDEAVAAWLTSPDPA